MRSIHHAVLLYGAALILAAPCLRAQAVPPQHETDVAVTYIAERSNLTPGEFFWRNGAAADASVNLTRGLGIAVNLSGSEARNILGTGVDLDSFTFAAGPRYTIHPGRAAVFGQALFGESHAWNSLFPQSGGSTTSANSFALLIGGGVDLHLGPRFAVRPIEAEWLRTQFPNATTGVQNNLRLGAGLVLRIR